MRYKGPGPALHSGQTAQGTPRGHCSDSTCMVWEVGASCESPDSGDLGRTCELVVLTSSQVKLMLQEPRREQRGVRLGETCRPGGWPSCVGGAGSAGTLEEGGVGTGRPGSGGVAGHSHGTYVHVCMCPGQFLRPLGWKHVYPEIDHLSLTVSHYRTLHPSHLG